MSIYLYIVRVSIKFRCDKRETIRITGVFYNVQPLFRDQVPGFARENLKTHSNNQVSMGTYTVQRIY
jgi:hypothetical protein